MCANVEEKSFWDRDEWELIKSRAMIAWDTTIDVNANKYLCFCFEL